MKGKFPRKRRKGSEIEKNKERTIKTSPRAKNERKRKEGK